VRHRRLLTQLLYDVITPEYFFSNYLTALCSVGTKSRILMVYNTCNNLQAQRVAYLVNSTGQVDDNFSGTVVVYNFKLSYVTWHKITHTLLHNNTEYRQQAKHQMHLTNATVNTDANSGTVITHHKTLSDHRNQNLTALQIVTNALEHMGQWHFGDKISSQPLADFRTFLS